MKTLYKKLGSDFLMKTIEIFIKRHVRSTSKRDYFLYGECISKTHFSDTNPRKLQIRQFGPGGKN